MSKMSFERRFEREAKRWEAWCEEKSFEAMPDWGGHDSVRNMVAMGKDIVPLIFERWPERKDGDGGPFRPPWWIVLERVTGKRMVSDSDKIAQLPANLRGSIDPRGILSVPGLEEERWRKWWEEKSGGSVKGVRNEWHLNRRNS